MAKDSGARIQLSRSFHQEGTFNLKLTGLDSIASDTTDFFFKISAKDTKYNLLILVTQISVIHQSKLLSVYFYLRTLTITTKLCGFEKKQKTNRVRSLSSPSPRTAFRNTSLK